MLRIVVHSTGLSLASSAFRASLTSQLPHKLSQLRFQSSIMASQVPTPRERKHKVSIVGSGNWGTAIAKIVAENTASHPELFERDVQMWVFEESYQMSKDSPHSSDPLASSKQPLSKLINHFHENVKYLPGIRLPDNLIANPNIRDSVKDSTILVFNLPHQFIEKTCADLQGAVLPYARGVSCIKGVNVNEAGISLFSDLIASKLGIYCGALSGANIANEVAAEKFCETTVAYNPPTVDLSLVDSARAVLSSDGIQAAGSRLAASIGHTTLTPMPSDYPNVNARLLKSLFHRPYFHVRVTTDVTATSLAGALKNVVALAAGFVIGLGWGDNAKAAIMRVGIVEMVSFAKRFFPGKGVKDTTFTEESAGVADLITSCSSGRNFRCARMATEEGVQVKDIEKRELNGQILQGVGTSEEVYRFLSKRGLEHEYPLFTAVYLIVHGEKQPQDLPEMLEPKDGSSTRIQSRPSSPTATTHPSSTSESKL